MFIISTAPTLKEKSICGFFIKVMEIAPVDA
jgi:hypothetical protein